MVNFGVQNKNMSKAMIDKFLNGEKSGISEYSGLITLGSTGAVLVNQFLETPMNDATVSAFVAMALSQAITFILRQIDKRKA